MLKAGELKPGQLFKVSTDAWRRGGAPSGTSTMYAALNSEVSVLDLLKGSIIHSANDACLALAEGIAGSEQAFLPHMTAKAKELGLQASTFRNVTGLPDPDHKMSVRDIATVARYIIQNHPDYFPLYGEKSFTWNKIQQPNRNPLLADFPGADGMKTGYTADAGYGLVGTVSRNGRRLIMVIAGLASIDERKTEAQKLLNWGLRQFRSVDVYAAGDRVGQARVWGGSVNWVDLVTRDAFAFAMTKIERETAEVRLAYSGPLLAPVKAGTEVGSVKIFVEGRSIAEIPVLTAEDVPAVDSMWQKALDSALIMVFGG